MLIPMIFIALFIYSIIFYNVGEAKGKSKKERKDELICGISCLIIAILFCFIPIFDGHWIESERIELQKNAKGQYLYFNYPEKGVTYFEYNEELGEVEEKVIDNYKTLDVKSVESESYSLVVYYRKSTCRWLIGIFANNIDYSPKHVIEVPEGEIGYK